MRINFFLAQKETHVGNIEKNFSLLKRSYLQAEKHKCDIFLSSELALSGYPPKDLLFKDDFKEKIGFYIEKFKSLTKGRKCILGLGTPFYSKNKTFNSFLLFENNMITHRVDKAILPNFGVFDEKRYFAEGLIKNKHYKFGQAKILFLICEDFWNNDYLKKIKKNKPDFVVVVNASPFEPRKFEKRIDRAKKVIKLLSVPIIYLNAIGTQDDLIFDGGSFLMSKKYKILNNIQFFQEKNIKLLQQNKKNEQEFKIKSDLNYEIYEALIFSLRSYFKKNKFKSIIIGISGGIDSAIVATLACDAVGPERVSGYMLPSKFTSEESMQDAIKLSKSLGFILKIIEIEKLKNLYLKNLNEFFKGSSIDTTEENLQSRIRGNILMAISNKFNSLLLATGNKSELAVGYSTLYGDMCGGFSPIKDIYKTKIFELSEWRNSKFIKSSKVKKINVIPENIILKEPTAELRENQKDIDSLPPYELLDKILFFLIEKNLGKKEIVKRGFEQNMIERIWQMIKNSEFKRYQSCLGPKLSEMCFDNDRRFPIINNFKI